VADDVVVEGDRVGRAKERVARKHVSAASIDPRPFCILRPSSRDQRPLLLRPASASRLEHAYAAVTNGNVAILQTHTIAEVLRSRPVSVGPSCPPHARSSTSGPGYAKQDTFARGRPPKKPPDTSDWQLQPSHFGDAISTRGAGQSERVRSNVRDL